MPQEVIRIVHLSDLHFTEKSLENEVDKRWYGDLSEDICSTLTKSPRFIDFIVVCGDLTHSGRKEEFAVAGTFLRLLVAKMGVSLKQVLLVPGNHDLNHAETHGNSSRNFYDFAREIIGPTALGSPVQEYADLGVDFLLYDTAAMGMGKPKFTGKCNELRIRNTSKYLIKVLHHAINPEESQPFQWDSKWWRYNRQETSNSFRLQLWGHQQGAASPSLRSSISAELVSEAGPLSGEAWRRSMSPPQYRIFEIADRTVKLITRTYFAQSAKWVGDMAKSLIFDRIRKNRQVEWHRTDSLLLASTTERVLGPKYERSEVVEGLNRLTDEELLVLIEKLRPSLPSFSPWLESRSEFCSRLVAYFENDNSLGTLADAVTSLTQNRRSGTFQVGLSYSRADRLLGKTVAEAAVRLGFDVKIVSDERSQSAFKNVHFLVLLLSERAMKSKSFKQEVDLGIQAALVQQLKLIVLQFGATELPDILRNLDVWRVEKEDNVTVVITEALKRSAMQWSNG